MRVSPARPGSDRYGAQAGWGRSAERQHPARPHEPDTPDEVPMTRRDDVSVRTILDAARHVIQREAAALADLIDQIGQSTADVVGLILATTGKVITTRT